MFETDRLILRAFRECDYDDLLRLWNDPIMQRLGNIDYTVPRGSKYKDDVLKRDVESALIYAVVTHKETGAWMGICTLAIVSAKNRDAMIGIVLIAEYQNNGYGTEAMRFIVNHAFTSLGLHRVSLAVLEGNERAIAVYKKLGFSEEGRRRQANWVDGKWEALVWMGILDTEWVTPASSAPETIQS